MTQILSPNSEKKYLLRTTKSDRAIQILPSNHYSPPLPPHHHDANKSHSEQSMNSHCCRDTVKQVLVQSRQAIGICTQLVCAIDPGKGHLAPPGQSWPGRYEFNLQLHPLRKPGRNLPPLAHFVSPESKPSTRTVRVGRAPRIRKFPGGLTVDAVPPLTIPDEIGECAARLSLVGTILDNN